MSDQSSDATAVAAGAATVTAEVAREESAEAAEIATVAVATAEDAHERASEAAVEAWSAQDAVSKLRTDMETGFGAIAEMLAARTEKVEPSTTAPADSDEPVAPDKRDKPAGAEPPPDAKHKGRLRWRSDW